MNSKSIINFIVNVVLAFVLGSTTGHAVSLANGSTKVVITATRVLTYIIVVYSLYTRDAIQSLKEDKDV